jgi:hypothetical protein
MNERKRKMMSSRHVSQFLANYKLELGFYIYDKEKFLILNFFKKHSPLNAIMRKNLYFGLIKIHTHDVFI